MTHINSKLIDFDALFNLGGRKSIIDRQIDIIYLNDPSLERRDQIEQYIRAGYTYLYQQVYPFIFPPTTLVVVDTHPELGISFRDVARRAVVWPEDWDDADALWFFGHEATEAFVIRYFGDNAPRWLIETFAQLGAYRMCRYALGGIHTTGEQDCIDRGFVPYTSLLDWQRPHLNLTSSDISEVEHLSEDDLIKIAENYIHNEHNTSIEDQRYATAWKLGMETVPENSTIGEALSVITQNLHHVIFETFCSLNHSKDTQSVF